MGEVDAWAMGVCVRLCVRPLDCSAGLKSGGCRVHACTLPSHPLYPLHPWGPNVRAPPLPSLLYAPLPPTHPPTHLFPNSNKQVGVTRRLCELDESTGLSKTVLATASLLTTQAQALDAKYLVTSTIKVREGRRAGGWVGGWVDASYLPLAWTLPSLPTHPFTKRTACFLVHPPTAPPTHPLLPYRTRPKA